MRPWRWLYTVPLRLRTLLRRSQVEHDLDAEMEYHIECRIQQEVARGASPAEARRIALIAMDGIALQKEECRERWHLQFLSEILHDVRYGVRMLRKSPQFSVAAIGILTLSIGANSALFTLFSNYALRPVAIRGYDRHFDLVALDSHARRTWNWTPEELATLGRQTTNEIEGLYTTDTIQVLMLAPVQRPVLASIVSGNYFRLLGGSAWTGRTFEESDEREPVAVLSHSGWQKLMQGDPAAVGKYLRVRSTSYRIAGIMRPEFTGAELVVPDFWVPSGMGGAMREEKGVQRYSASGLLRPGITAARAEAVLTAVAVRLDRTGEAAVSRVEVRARPSFFARDQDTAVAATLVFAAFFTVLLIACANLANLYLARAASRTPEVAMRLSLGASRWRIVRQLLTEGVLIALAGAALGLALSTLGVNKLQDYLFTTVIGMGISVQPTGLDWRVFLYVAGLGVAAGAAFSLLPALEATSPSLTASAKRDHSAFAGRIRPRRLRNLLIGGQVAGSLVLLVLALTLTVHIRRLDSSETGFDLDRVWDLRVDRAVTRRLLERVEQRGPIERVTVASRVPLFGQLPKEPAVVDGNTVFVASNRVDHRFFETLRMGVLQGRGFSAQEAESQARLAVVSAAAAKKLWPSTSAIGRTIAIPPSSTEYQVIGVVQDIVSGFLFQGVDPAAVYLPAAAGQDHAVSAMARVAGNPAAAKEAIRKLCLEVEGTGCEPMTAREIASLQRFPFQAAAAVSSVLGAMGLLLTAIGLYGIVSYSVVQRRREIGVHAALGAAPWRIVRRILGEALRCVAGGIAAGLPVCLFLSKAAASSVLQIHSLGPVLYLSVPAMLGFISVLACLGPARRAAAMDPMRALREA